MLRLSAEQFEAFCARQRALFLHSLERAARAEMPAIVSETGSDELRNRLEAAVHRAESFGILESGAIERVVLMAIDTDGAVWAEPDGWGLDILKDPNRSGLSKALALEWRTLSRLGVSDG